MKEQGVNCLAPKGFYEVKMVTCAIWFFVANSFFFRTKYDVKSPYKTYWVIWGITLRPYPENSGFNASVETAIGNVTQTCGAKCKHSRCTSRILLCPTIQRCRLNFCSDSAKISDIL